MHRMIIFDDGRGQLGPMTDLRASFELRTGLSTTACRCDRLRPKTLVGYWVPERLRAVVAERANAPVNTVPNEEVLYCINGRWATPDVSLEPAVGEALVEQDTGDVVAVMLRRADAEYFLQTGQLHERVRRQIASKRLLYRYPWEIVALMPQTIPHDILSTRLLDAQVPGETATVLGEHPVKIHRSATVYPQVVLDAERGPILVEKLAVIRPGAILCGPCAIGRESIVLDRAVIKPNTAIGPHCKVGGEIGSCIFQGCSNKAHEGHLGDSWVGEWVNFGAGTINSNLLNTYGEIKMQLEAIGARHRTGMQFLGAIIGDHVKFAINTRIMSGSVIGTGAMVATTAPPPSFVNRFAWLTDDGQEVYELDQFLKMCAHVMARRNAEPTEAYIQLLRNLHAEATAH